MTPAETTAILDQDAIPAEVRLEETPCPLGCPPGDDVVITGRDRLNDLPGRYTVVKCRTCGLMRTNPRPTPDTIGYYYPDNYGPYVSTRVNKAPSQTPGAAPSARPLWKTLGRALFQTNTHRLPIEPPGRLLEVGCASGALLSRMASRGWEVEGIEYSPKAAQAARDLGYKVYTGALEGAPDPEKPYDLVTGWMVVEHLHDPVAALKKLSRWTRPGGWLAISVPNAASPGLKSYGEDWYPLCVPVHLYHYTPDSLSKLFAASGWKMDHVFPQRILSNTIASTGYRLRSRKSAPALAEKLVGFTSKPTRAHLAMYPLALAASLVVPLGCMTVWARNEGG